MLTILPFIALFMPLVSSLIILFTHKRFSYHFVAKFAVSMLFISFVATLVLWFFISSVSGVFFFDFAETFKTYWFCSNWLVLSLTFVFDELCLFMFLLVISVSFCVHMYSIEYMHLDPDRTLFFGYLSLFTFFMLLLVSSGNLIQFFWGWEGIGMCSYLLINFWYMRIEANKAAIKAVVVNKIGDCAFLIGIGLIYLNFGSLNIVTISSLLSNYVAFNFLNVTLPFFLFLDSWTLAAFFLLIAAMAKSAQIGLHTWLPDAMEGPTPVSALIHAATMVTAGIFLIIRCNKIFEVAPIILHLAVYIGAITAFFAASVALVQNDIKKIIAYSTCSQLGYMLVACGLSKYGIAFFHLFTHGFFKALLFLCAGAILHGVHDTQDLRQMGGLGHVSKFLYVIMHIGSFALTGFPFLSGFYSKELILLTTVFDTHTYFFYLLLLIGAFFTSFYSFRLSYLSFFAGQNYNIQNSFHQSGFYINVSLFILAFGTIFFGYIFQNYFLLFDTEIEVLSFLTTDQIPQFFQLLVLILLSFNFFGFVVPRTIDFLFTTVYWNLYFQYQSFRSVVWFFSKKWYFDKFYNNFITRFFFRWSFKFFLLLDCYLFEVFGPSGIVYVLVRGARVFSKMQTGSIFFYFSLIIVSCFVLFFFVLPI